MKFYNGHTKNKKCFEWHIFNLLKKEKEKYVLASLGMIFNIIIKWELKPTVLIL